MTLLAKAETAPDGWTNVVFGMTLLGVAAVAFVLATVPVVIARRRGIRAVGGVTLLCVVWGIVTAGDVGYALLINSQISRTNDQQLQSGYARQSDLDRAPVWPWVVLVAAAGGYAGIALYAANARKTA